MRLNPMWGVLFVAAGVTALLVQLGILPGDVYSLWPIGVMLVGLWLLFGALSERRPGGFTAGLVTVAAGAYWLAQELSLVRSGLFFPIVLIALGVGVLLRPTRRAGAA